jgi:hypothetical protein
MKGIMLITTEKIIVHRPPQRSVLPLSLLLRLVIVLIVLAIIFAFLAIHLCPHHGRCGHPNRHS